MKCDIADVDELCDEMMRANIYYQLRRHEPGAFEELKRILFEKRFYPACFRALKGSAI